MGVNSIAGKELYRGATLTHYTKEENQGLASHAIVWDEEQRDLLSILIKADRVKFYVESSVDATPRVINVVKGFLEIQLKPVWNRFNWAQALKPEPGKHVDYWRPVKLGLSTGGTIGIVKDDIDTGRQVLVIDTDEEDPFTGKRCRIWDADARSVKVSNPEKYLLGTREAREWFDRHLLKREALCNTAIRYVTGNLGEDVELCWPSSAAS